MLTNAGIPALFDDRTESPGVKFADADLIGLPLRVAASAKSLGAGGFEVKRRLGQEKTITTRQDLVACLTKHLVGESGCNS